MFCGNVFEARRAHCTGPKYDLASARIEGFQKLDNPAHCVCHKRGQIDDYAQVVREQCKHLECGGHSEEMAVFDLEVLAGPMCVPPLAFCLKVFGNVCGYGRGRNGRGWLDDGPVDGERR